MSHTAPTADFWKRKLAAFLHDSPSKALDIAGHEWRASAAYSRAGLAEFIGHYDKKADHTAAAADRLPWPSRQISCQFNGVENRFHHPLSGQDLLPSETKPISVQDAEATEQDLQPQLDTPTSWSEDEKWRANYFAHWRLWRRNCTEHNPALGFLPAETRLPDHTIWHHMGVVSALAANDGQHAFLKFQLGPVQDFIAAARSTRDLWSGSYLISWLMATGLAALARAIGPDAVIYPSLHGQPLFDLQFRDELWLRCKTATTPGAPDCWQSLNYSDEALLTPNLPNVFLAIVPAARAEALAKLVESAIRTEWSRISDTVLDFSKELLTPAHTPACASDRFAAQVSRHLDLAWQTTPWPATPEAALNVAEGMLPRTSKSEPASSTKRLRDFIRYFTEIMPVEQRDSRYYIDASKTKLNNAGAAWSVLVALNAWQLDATRQTRAFLAWNTGTAPFGSTHNTKDALTGREEMILGGAPWREAIKDLRIPKSSGKKWGELFRHTDEVGALTLIKRTWHLAYLRDVVGLQPHAMPNTYQLATGDATHDDDGSDQNPQLADKDKYYAILALDGDSIGQIVSGEKTPALRDQLADYRQSNEAKGAVRYFTENKGTGLLDLPRPLSPGYHLQFSEALSNFALHCAPRIVAKYAGKLLYAGGDDVLALIPAAHALACADDLQRAFRGQSPSSDCGLTEVAPGFLKTAAEDDRAALTFIVPGPSCTASIGLAVAHFKAPLQDVIRAAQRAQKIAKKLDGKHALSVCVMKRSGEITEWSTRFDADRATHAHRGGLPALQWLLCALGCNIGSTPDRKRPPLDEVLSSKFPYRLSALLEPHLSEHGLIDTLKPEELTDLVTRELNHVIDRQRGPAYSAASAADTLTRLREALLTYLGNLPGTPTEKFKQLLGLLATAAFLGRQPALNAK